MVEIVDYNRWKETGNGRKKNRVELEEKGCERDFDINKIQIQETSRGHIDVNPRANTGKQ